VSFSFNKFPGGRIKATMTFFSLLTKEMRLRLRRERTIWVIVFYLVLMALLGWISISGYSANDNSYGGADLSGVGLNLYYLLSLLQLFLIVFITPAFTATAINGEKERQTFDLLLCSRLSPLSLMGGKLLAGLTNAILLVAASIPLFSLVFFFGGVSPSQAMSALVVYIVTVVLVGTFALLCSTLFARPAVSTVMAYVLSIFWIALPLLYNYVLLSSSNTRLLQMLPDRMRLLAFWNPVTALSSTYPANSNNLLTNYGTGGPNSYGYGLSMLSSAFGYGNVTPYMWGNWQIAPWIIYSIVSLLVACMLFGLSMLAMRVYPITSWRGFGYRKMPS
jgi:ABC-type transport system involved in multi-copper enzyme maturation permease subunit